MSTSNIIVIGAGAAGLMAAYRLVSAGKSVTILEARDRIGGRIHTTTNCGFSEPTELGAEFVHGDLPVTLGLLKEAGIATNPVNFEMWQNTDGVFAQSEFFIPGWESFLVKVNELKQDMPLHDFMVQNFAGDGYSALRKQIEEYVSGYDTADVYKVSTFALRNEWNHEDEDAQHRVHNGYSGLMAYLANRCVAAGAEILLGTAVKEIHWQGGSVTVKCSNDAVFTAEKIVVAMPLGVLKLPAHETGAVTFSPPLPQYNAAIQNIGFGAVVKILLEFKNAFWEPNLSTMGFLFTNGQPIPTFWTQSPKKSPLITGWIGGPPAANLKDTPDTEILKLAMESLSSAFGISQEVLNNKLMAWKVVNWTADVFTRGSYAYDTVKSTEARGVLLQPVADTVYFAGEYLYNGPAMGTVEAALNSAENVTGRILR